MEAGSKITLQLLSIKSEVMCYSSSCEIRFCTLDLNALHTLRFVGVLSRRANVSEADTTPNSLIHRMSLFRRGSTFRRLIIYIYIYIYDCRITPQVQQQ